MLVSSIMNLALSPVPVIALDPDRALFHSLDYEGPVVGDAPDHVYLARAAVAGVLALSGYGSRSA